MKARIALVLMLGFSGGVDSQTLYKCVSKGQPVSYQSEPCVTAKATAKTWAAQPEPEPTNAELWRRHNAKKRADADSRYLSALAGRARASSGQGAAISKSSDRWQCDAAKRERDEFLKGIGRDAGIDARRVFHDRVYESCK